MDELIGTLRGYGLRLDERDERYEEGFDWTVREEDRRLRAFLVLNWEGDPPVEAAQAVWDERGHYAPVLFVRDGRAASHLWVSSHPGAPFPVSVDELFAPGGKLR